MKRLLVASITLLSLTAMAFAQDGFVNADSNALVRINPITAKATSFAWNPTAVTSGVTRGHIMGAGGKVYRSAWSVNGIVVNDYRSTTPTVSILVQDTSNLIMGAPYQPAWDLNARGGPGIVCIDGNAPGTPAPAGYRNFFSVDVNAKTWKMTAWFITHFVPMSDMYNNPHKSGEFIGVGWNTSDPHITTWKIPSTPGPIAPTVLLDLLNFCKYDALIHEDQKLYCWVSSPARIGFQVVDIKNKTQKFLAVSSSAASPITHPIASTGYAAVWNDPFEKPGRMAYVLQELGATDQLWSVDLLTGKASPITLTIPAGTYNTGRSVEDAQLTSWRDKTSPTKRRFHIDFGNVQTADQYFLFPTIAGYGPKITVNGLEVWLTPDVATVMAATGQLGTNLTGVYLPSQPKETDIDFDLGTTLGIDIVWAAALIRGNKVVDITNYIIVAM